MRCTRLISESETINEEWGHTISIMYREKVSSSVWFASVIAWIGLCWRERLVNVCQVLNICQPFVLCNNTYRFDLHCAWHVPHSWICMANLFYLESKSWNVISYVSNKSFIALIHKYHLHYTSPVYNSQYSYTLFSYKHKIIST